mmetsp:Transcript_84624/g.134107  ORF Transcript_84624/g.134107 Transcript_84624/m.134107 type:complete len:224 (-) Transcript_84624:320-991(-)
MFSQNSASSPNKACCIAFLLLARPVAPRLLAECFSGLSGFLFLSLLASLLAWVSSASCVWAALELVKVSASSASSSSSLEESSVKSSDSVPSVRCDFRCPSWLYMSSSNILPVGGGSNGFSRSASVFTGLPPARGHMESSPSTRVTNFARWSCSTACWVPRRPSMDRRLGTSLLSILCTSNHDLHGIFQLSRDQRCCNNTSAARTDASLTLMAPCFSDCAVSC